MNGYLLNGRIEAQIHFADILGHTILWLILGVITLGIAFMFYPYSFAKMVLNRTYVVDQNGLRARLQCDLDIASQFGHILIWFLLTIVTVGLAYPFYLYKTWHFALNRTRLLLA